MEDPRAESQKPQATQKLADGLKMPIENARAKALAASEAAKLQPVNEKLMVRGQGEYQHDCFRGSIASMKRNESFRKTQLQIVEIPHIHLFHSHDRSGKPNNRCAPVGGHYHDVKIIREEGKAPRVECGPPMRKVIKQGKFGLQKTAIEQVRWVDYQADADGGVMVSDTHTHDFEYQFTEFLKADFRLPAHKGDEPKIDPKFRAEVQGI